MGMEVSEIKDTRMKTAIIELTPELAEILLNNNEINRGFNWSQGKFIKEAIESGTYKLNHQGIAISEDGNLMDGQHRCKAVIETGKSILTPITIDVPRENLHGIDLVKARSI